VPCHRERRRPGMADSSELPLIDRDGPSSFHGPVDPVAAAIRDVGRAGVTLACFHDLSGSSGSRPVLNRQPSGAALRPAPDRTGLLRGGRVYVGYGVTAPRFPRQPARLAPGTGVLAVSDQAISAHVFDYRNGLRKQETRSR
jgi:hypothetical protein